MDRPGEDFSYAAQKLRRANSRSAGARVILAGMIISTRSILARAMRALSVGQRLAGRPPR
jgi:hypothetical protein